MKKLNPLAIAGIVSITIAVVFASLIAASPIAGPGSSAGVQHATMTVPF